MSRKFTTPEIDDALKIARETREILLQGTVSVESSLLGFYTVAEILGEHDDLDWAYKELNRRHVGNPLPAYRKELFGRYLDDQRNPVSAGKSETLTHAFYDGIPKIEQILKHDKSEIIYAISSDDVKKLQALGYDQVDKTWAIEYPKSEIGSIIGAVKLELIKRLNKMINQFTYGEVPENIFEYVRNEVDAELAKLCPKAIEKLPKVYAQLSSNDEVIYSEVASTCRRIIKDVADALYPASDSPVMGMDGKEHKLSESDYTNRIMARIQQSIQNGNEKKIFSSMFEYVDGLLTSINDYASKGVHSDFTKTDAVRCIVYTYLLLGDIIHYYVKPDENA